MRQAAQGAYDLHLSPILIEEVRRSLRHPRLTTAYGYEMEAVDSWNAWLLRIGHLLTQPLPEIPPTCRDSDDDHVIAAALAARASWIVTGDKDLLALARHEGIRIVTARAFLDQIIQA